MHLGFRFDQPTTTLNCDTDRVELALSNRVIEGPGDEHWATVSAVLPGIRGLAMWQCGTEVWGAATCDTASLALDAAARELYRALFEATGHLTLQRVWNFVPRINEHDGDIENYQAFCRGRHCAFEAHFGADIERRMPAASAVGTEGDTLSLVFIAGTGPVRYVENPQQVPAYRYPSAYGPRAPSFARASLVRREHGARLYVSGTASIRRSESLHPGDVAAQFRLALENVDLVARAAGLTDGVDGRSPGRRSFRIYLRHPQDWPAVRAVFRERLFRDGDRFNAVQADICRRELLVEIEACIELPADCTNNTEEIV